MPRDFPSAFFLGEYLKMIVLGIETSCDETAAAVLENGNELRSNVIASQNEIHSLYGGIVPELAGRSHIERIHGIINEALSKAEVTFSDIDLIAVTQGPGLVGSLLVGLNTGKALAYASKIPLIAINHLEGHICAIFLEQEVEFPYLSLIVSGGHTDLCRVENFGKYKILGRTRDDAAGESFDKVAKMLGLGYPGGPIIEKMASKGNPSSFNLPRALVGNGTLDFSFSGLKSSVRRLIEKSNSASKPLDIPNISASFQEAVVDVLTMKAMDACESERLNRIVLTGGVAANSYLRERLKSAAQKRNIKCYFPKPIHCTDNAAMIACTGFHLFKTRGNEANSLLDLDALANLPI